MGGEKRDLRLLHYLIEFAGLMAVFSLVIVAPGADTAMVMRQSLAFGRHAGVFTSVGVGASLLLHLTATILGLGLLVAKSLAFFNLLKLTGATYLLVMGIRLWRSPAFAVPDVKAGFIAPSNLKSFGLGFITNALNPKPVLFFLSLFSTLVSPQTPLLVQGLYGIGMAAALIGWFVMVANVLTVPSVRDRFTTFGRWLNRVTGAIFVGLGVKLALEQV